MKVSEWACLKPQTNIQQANKWRRYYHIVHRCSALACLIVQLFSDVRTQRTYFQSNHKRFFVNHFEKNPRPHPLKFMKLNNNFVIRGSSCAGEYFRDCFFKVWPISTDIWKVMIIFSLNRTFWITPCVAVYWNSVKTEIFSEKKIQVENRYTKKQKCTYEVYCLITIDGINVIPLSDWATVHKLHNYFAAHYKSPKKKNILYALVRVQYFVYILNQKICKICLVLSFRGAIISQGAKRKSDSNVNGVTCFYSFKIYM